MSGKKHALCKSIIAAVTAAATALGLFCVPRVTVHAEETVPVYYDLQPVSTDASFSNLVTGNTYLFLPYGNGNDDVSNYDNHKPVADVEIPDIDFAQPTLPIGCYLFKWDPGLKLYGLTPNTITSSLSTRYGYTGNVTVVKQGGKDECPYGVLELAPNYTDYFKYWCQRNGIHELKGKLYAYQEAQVPASAFNVTSKKDLDQPLTLTEDDLIVTITINGRDYKVNKFEVIDGAINPPNDLTVDIKFSTLGVSFAFHVIPPLNVSFDLNGHGTPPAPEPQAIPHGYKVVEPTAPVDDTMVFDGWYTDAACTPANKWDFNHEVTTDFTLYAKWLGALKITTQTLPSGTIGTAYSATLTSEGGEGDKTWSIDSGELPAGLSLDAATGVLSGTPTATGETTFTVRVTDTKNLTDARAFTVKISDQPVDTHTVTFDVLGHGRAPAAQTVEAGTPAVRPADPSADGFVFKGWFVDPECTVAWDFAHHVEEDMTLYALWLPELRITTAALPAEISGNSYAQILDSTLNPEEVTWTLIGGSLPAGLTLDPSGAITGTPSAAGIYYFTVRVTDIRGQSVTRELSIHITDIPITYYTVTFHMRGHGTAPRSQTIAEGDTAVRPDDPHAAEDGYTFTGWYADPTYTEPWDFDTRIITSDVTIYAGWNPPDPWPEPTPEPEPEPAPAPEPEPEPEPEPRPEPYTHEHQGEWVTIEPASGDEDGVMVYRCTICGETLQTEPLTAYYKFNLDAANAIRTAAGSASVNVATTRWISFHRMVFEALDSRPDVTLNVDYLSDGYKGTHNSFSVPAGVGTAALPAGTNFAGFYYLTGLMTGPVINRQNAMPAIEQRPAAQANTAAVAPANAAGGRTVTIPQGVGSDAVAAILAREGLVNSAREFDLYLCEHGFDRDIRSGTRTIPEGASWQDMARILTGRAAQAPAANAAPAVNTTPANAAPTAETAQTVNAAPAQAANTVTVSIPDGAGSDQVARLLESAGLVDSAAAFDRYLCDHNYDRHIKSGTKNIPAGADRDQIAAILTR